MRTSLIAVMLVMVPGGRLLFVNVAMAIVSCATFHPREEIFISGEDAAPSSSKFSSYSRKVGGQGDYTVGCDVELIAHACVTRWFQQIKGYGRARRG
jgi:hypothetical protein